VTTGKKGRKGEKGTKVKMRKRRNGKKGEKETRLQITGRWERKKRCEIYWKEDKEKVRGKRMMRRE
jgi:hypothetical protein